MWPRRILKCAIYEPGDQTVALGQPWSFWRQRYECHGNTAIMALLREVVRKHLSALHGSLCPQCRT